MKQFTPPWRDWMTDDEIDQALAYLEKRGNELKLQRAAKRPGRQAEARANAAHTKRQMEMLRKQGILSNTCERAMQESILRDEQVAAGIDPDPSSWTTAARIIRYSR